MKLDILFHYEVNEATGEITYIGKEEISVDTCQTSSSKPKSTSKSAIKNTSPQLILEGNKYLLTDSAIILLNVVHGDKLDIKYQKIDGRMTPVIGKDENGNKLCKSNTVSFRGVKHTELSKYGKEFNITLYKDGLFILNSTTADDSLSELEDSNIGLEDNVLDDLPFDLSIDNEDVTEINSNFFKL